MVFAIVGINVLPMLSTMLVLLVLVGGLALAFVPDAIALLGVGPVRAILISLDIVRRFPWSALGLIFGINVVSLFAAVLFGPMVTTAIGLALAILGFAVIADRARSGSDELSQ